MGRIEDALRKLEQERRDPSARREARRGSAQADTSSRLEHISLESVTNVVELDKARLSRWGPVAMLGNDEHSKREYGHIKRPIITCAMADAPNKIPEGNIVLVTSAIPGEGKSLTSLNLALSLAREKDLSVLLIDGAILRPDLSRALGFKGAKGLVNLLTDETMQIKDVISGTSVPRLYFTPAGTDRVGAAELLGSGRMSQIVARLATDLPRTIVVIDSSPLLLANESRILASLAGQVVLVVRANSTPRLLVTEALEHLDPDKPLGLVLNGTDSPETAYYPSASYGAAEEIEAVENA